MHQEHGLNHTCHDRISSCHDGCSLKKDGATPPLFQDQHLIFKARFVLLRPLVETDSILKRLYNASKLQSLFFFWSYFLSSLSDANCKKIRNV